MLDHPDDVSARFAKETKKKFKVNKFGMRSIRPNYRPGVALDQDFKCSMKDGRACAQNALDAETFPPRCF